MVNIYDIAHELAHAIQQSPEYEAYQRAKTIAMENDTNKALLTEYKKLQLRLQVQVAGGGQPNADDMERFNKISAVLQMSNETTAYIMAEFQLQKMLADIYKILGDAIEIDLDMLQGL